MDTEVKTLLKIGDEFININDFTGEIPDEFYINGAIICRINNQKLFNETHWDLVDQLWAYILQGLESLQSDTDFSIYFPDQPLQLSFCLLNPKVVEVILGNKQFRFERTIFFRTLALGAENFFLRMKVLLPNDIPSWEIELNKAKKILLSQ